MEAAVPGREPQVTREHVIPPTTLPSLLPTDVPTHRHDLKHHVSLPSLLSECFRGRSAAKKEEAHGEGTVGSGGLRRRAEGQEPRKK